MNEELWLSRIQDLDGAFMESFTEQPDEELQKLSDLVSDLKAEEIGQLIIKWTQDYCGKEYED